MEPLAAVVLLVAQVAVLAEVVAGELQTVVPVGQM
jgi:hypothetical protein